MATSNLGTSVGLQGNYNNDYLQNLQLQEQKRGNLADEAFRQQEAQRKQQEIADKAMEDIVSIPKGRFLPQREEELKNETLGLLRYSVDKKSKNKSYNPVMDSDFQEKKIQLASKAKMYETERINVEGAANEMEKNIDTYDPRAIKEVQSVLSGSPFSEGMKNRLYQPPMVRDFSKFTNLEKHIQTAGFLDTENKAVQRVDANGVKHYVSEKGYDFSTPEKEKEQYGKTLEYVQSTRNNPYIQRLVADAEKVALENAEAQGVVWDYPIKGASQEERDAEAKKRDDLFTSTVDNLVAKKIIETAKNDIKNQTKDIDTPAGKGMNFITNMGGGKYQTKTGYYQVDQHKQDTESREQQFRNFEERNMPTILKKSEEKYKTQGKENPKKLAKDYWASEKGKAELRNRFEQSYPKNEKTVTKVYPALTPTRDGSNPEVNVVNSQGKTIAFTPSFYNIDEETNKPVSIYGVEVVRERGTDGTMKTIQKPVTIPYNTKNKVVNNVAPELVEVYKTETGKDIDLEVEEVAKSASEERKFNGVSYSLEELKKMAKSAGKTEKEANELWKTLTK